MPDPVPAAKTDTPPPAAEPAKPVETPKPADAPPPKPADAPPPPAGDKPPEPAKPAEPAKETDKKDPPPRGEDGKFVPTELKMPEGVKVDQKLMETFKSLAPTIGISTKQAQALLEMQIKATADQARQIDEAMQKQRVADLEALKGDKDFGGAKFDQTRAQVRSILEKTKYGPAVSKKLEAYGLDCDPDFTRFLAEVRSFIAEDSTSSRLTNPSPANGTQPMSQTERQARTYANTKPGH